MFCSAMKRTSIRDPEKDIMRVAESAGCVFLELLCLQNVKLLRITWINHIGGQIYGAVPVKGVG